MNKNYEMSVNTNKNKKSQKGEFTYGYDNEYFRDRYRERGIRF